MQTRISRGDPPHARYPRLRGRVLSSNDRSTTQSGSPYRLIGRRQPPRTRHSSVRGEQPRSARSSITSTGRPHAPAPLRPTGAVLSTWLRERGLGRCGGGWHRSEGDRRRRRPRIRRLHRLQPAGSERRDRSGASVGSLHPAGVKEVYDAFAAVPDELLVGGGEPAGEQQTVVLDVVVSVKVGLARRWPCQLELRVVDRLRTRRATWSRASRCAGFLAARQRCRASTEDYAGNPQTLAAYELTPNSDTRRPRSEADQSGATVNGPADASFRRRRPAAGAPGFPDRVENSLG